MDEKGQTEWDKFVKIEEHTATDDEEEGASSPLLAYDAQFSAHLTRPDAVLIELPIARPESYAFSVPLSSIYSLIVKPPSLSSWCEYGSSSLVSMRLIWII